MSRTKRWVATLVAASVSYAGMLQSAQAGLVGTAQVAEAQGVVSVDARAAEQRARVLSLLDRADVAAGLQEHGLSADQARERVAALTDAEVEQLCAHHRHRPGGRRQLPRRAGVHLRAAAGDRHPGPDEGVPVHALGALIVSDPGASRRRGRGPRAGSPSSRHAAPSPCRAWPASCSRQRCSAPWAAARCCRPRRRPARCSRRRRPTCRRAPSAPTPPFFPQTDYECGPAALATALGAAGIDVRPEALTEQVYLPARQGSLQLEMLAAARRRGALAVRLPGTLDALLRELAAGRPVVVLQNLSLPIVPRWHYAVVVGYDLAARELLLRSGTTERQALGLTPFEHTWARGGHWAFVAVPPGELPASASEDEVTAASVAFERVAQPAARAARLRERRWRAGPAT